MATGVQVWSGTPVNNATSDSNINWAEGMAPSQVNDSARSLMASVAKWRDDNTGVLVTSGTSGALTLATNQVESALTTGFTVKATLGTAVAAAATLAVDGLAATSIFTTLSTASLLSTGGLSVNQLCSFMYSTGVSTAGNSVNGWVVSAAPPTIAGITALQTGSAQLSASVSVATTAATTGVSVSLGTTGVWYVCANASFVGAVAENFFVQLSDGTTSALVAAGAEISAANALVPVSLCGIFTNPAGNVRITANLPAGAVNAVTMLSSSNSPGLQTSLSNIYGIRIG